MKNSIIRILICTTIAALCFPQPGMACSCIGKPSLAKDFADSDAIFVGKVISITPKHGKFARAVNELFNLNNDLSFYDVTVKLSVIESFKGLGIQKTVHVITSDLRCGYSFKENVEYLVFATGSPLETSVCHRTQPLSGSPEIKDVRSLVKSTIAGSAS